MKKVVSFLLVMLFLCNMNNIAFAIQENNYSKKPVKQSINATKIEIAFVFDSNSEKTNEILKAYKPMISKSLLPEYKAVFSDDLVFKGEWTEATSQKAAQKALQSRARMIICFGYWSGEYLKKNNKTKNVITVDQYAIRGFSDKFFNPVQQSVNDFVIFQRLVPNMGKTAILLNERVYNSKSNWNEIAQKGFAEKNCDIDFVIIPVGNDINKVLNSIGNDVKSVYVTQVYNLSTEQRKELYTSLAERKIPTFSSMGKEDVELGAMFGTSAKDLDKKLADNISFNIKNVLKGKVVKSTPVTFTDGNVLYFNQDTADAIGYIPHVRLLKSVEVITAKQPELRDLSYVFKTFEERNLSVQRKKYLISAAKRSLTAAYLHYLPTVRIDLGYQRYNDSYAESYTDVPRGVGQFVLGLDQVIYSPDLVTNIIVKHKKLNFQKAEKVLTEQTTGLEIAQLYIDYIMLKNGINDKKQYVDDIRNALAMAKIRKINGKCGEEEIMRLTGELNNAEKDLLIADAAFNNAKIAMNQLLYLEQKTDFDLAPIKVTDPAFFLSDINLLDHIRTPDKMEKFTQMVTEEAILVAPETTKLRAAIAMKKAEIGNYAQKFLLPSAKISLEYGNQFSRDLPYEAVGHRGLAAAGIPYIGLDENSARLFIAAQWKPIEGGTKIAEIARAKSELNELNTYLEDVNTEIEANIRSIINRAISQYLCIERSYRALAAEEENFRLVKEKYVMGKIALPQLMDGIKSVSEARVEAANSQYEFYKELVWLQRGLASVNWVKASPEAKKFIEKLKKELEPENDINVNL